MCTFTGTLASRNLVGPCACGSAFHPEAPSCLIEPDVLVEQGRACGLAALRRDD